MVRSNLVIAGSNFIFKHVKDNYSKYLAEINNAGSIFCGPLSPESFGDYSSGSNHILPTNGMSKVYSGLSVNDFGKYMSVQTASSEGFNNIKDTVIEMAKAETLDAHEQAVKIREPLALGQKISRISSEINLGTGDSFEMLQITRAHGNLIEYALFFLILSFLLETVGQIPNLATGLLGDFFLASRIAHAYGITRPEGKSNFRAAGTFITMAVLLIQSIYLYNQDYLQYYQLRTGQISNHIILHLVSIS